MPKHYEYETKQQRDSLEAESTLSDAFDAIGDAPLLEGSWSSRDGRRRTRQRIPNHWPWIVSTILFAVISICLVVMDGVRSYHRRTYETGFDTELDSAFPAIHIKKVRFTGGLHYDENGTVLRNSLPGGGPEWVGPPNPATDKLWDDLGHIAGVALVGHEADMVRGRTKQLQTGEYITGLDVFHQLHCLNKVRKALYPAYYHDPDGSEISALHTGELLQIAF
ncbi:hypothetical protein CBER1_09242 [Cercospora berteroae]|uniref:Uncharacterized protein n=1 Tax=Cercospora berteroae TaxID=357750 RepID=A0A2S6BXU4_9PEZI|nr:hypothetical protein CBER1_09242 [Cercospora berteroae]